MRVTFVLPPDALVGGIRVIAIYAQRLAQRGHRVTVVQPRHPRPGFREVLRSLRHYRRLPQAPDAGPSYFDGLSNPVVEAMGGCARGGGWVRRIKLSHTGPITAEDVPDADVVIATWWETAEWVWALPPEKGEKAHFMQDYEIWAGQVERVDATCRLPIPKIVIARWVSNLLSTRFGQEPIAWIPNAVDARLFSAAPRGKQVVPRVGFTYTPMRNKGADVSIKAIELARREVPELQVVSFGSHAPVAQLPLPAGTDFFHRVPDRELSSIYASCDAWLFGTRIEGFGLPILEAMACRTPVIGTPAGAAPELLSHGGGKLVGMEDAEAMSRAIVGFCRMSEDEWRGYSSAAYATATSYSWEDATDRFEAALEQVLRGEVGRGDLKSRRYGTISAEGSAARG